MTITTTTTELIKTAYKGFDTDLLISVLEKEIELDPYDLDERFPNTKKWCESCYHPPEWGEIVMEIWNEITDGCGVEAITIDGEIVADYVNTGDSYYLTLIRIIDTDEFILSSPADFQEEKEHEIEEEENKRKCSYCGEFNEINSPYEDSPELTTCHCGNYVDGEKIKYGNCYSCQDRKPTKHLAQTTWNEATKDWDADDRKNDRINANQMVPVCIDCCPQEFGK